MFLTSLSIYIRTHYYIVCQVVLKIFFVYAKKSKANSLRFANDNKIFKRKIITKPKPDAYYTVQ